jgi:hypothetical protein
MKNGKVRKATAEEIANYSALGGNLYPLSHYVMVDGMLCPVERLGSHHDGDPKYEIMLPAGYHARYECVHTLLCYDLADVRDRAQCLLSRCDADCD